ncbi:GNAT family N-acetyltransferase [Neomegalonema sp.]|uniref:GNAT family N-acetyltransferase n=1 Tax=Neomegalonema sp. TaxID=2039713 RepID=UPI00261FDF2C|nr:GNAT family N-acetyltransferase [Neomegalonema sp.]MDD2867528.1 GNAT family N-acetyltransferase [Neomegalonema sp.]
MDRQEAMRLFALSARLWPAAETAPLGPWLLRADPSTTRRANALGVFGPPEESMDRAMAGARAWYAARGRRPLAQIRLEDRAARDWLAARGSTPFGATCVMVVRPPVAAAREGLRVESAPEPPAVWAEVESHGPEDFPARLAVMLRPERRSFVTLFEGAEALGTAHVAAAEDLALISAVSVRPEARGRGLGGALMGAALERAAALGAARATVQVEAANAPARRLYARLGFREAFSYAYAGIPE